MPRKPTKQRELLWGDGTVRQRQNKDGTVSWQARWWEEGADGEPARRAKSFASERDATEYLRQIRHAKAEGRYQPESRMTVGQMVAAYMNRARHGWKPNTTLTNQVMVTRLVLPELGPRRLTQLTTSQVQQWVDRLARRAVSPSAIANAHSLLKASLRQATNLGLVPRNVAEGVSLPPRDHPNRPTWTMTEVRTVLATVADDPRRAAMYGLMLSTGMRPGEVRALTWGSLTLDGPTPLVVVSQTITKDVTGAEILGSTTKTGRARAIALPAFVVEAFRRWRKVQLERRLAHPSWVDTDIVLDRGDGRFLPNESIQVIHRRTIEEAGVSPIRLHDIRHTYATLASAHGMNPKIVTERLGHASTAFTMDRYTHVSVQLQQTAAELLARRLFEDDPDGSDTTTSDDREPNQEHLDARMGTRNR
jgi:integrase